MAQDQGTYPGLCLLTNSDGKVITIEDSVSHDTVVFTHTNTGEGEFAICYPEVLGSGVPVAALANFGTQNVENTATQGYAFTLGDEEYLVRQNVIAPTPGEINDVLYSRSLLVDVNTWDVLVTKDGNVVKYLNGSSDNVCFIKYAGGEWHAETDYYDQVVEASGLDPVSIGCTVADGVYTIKYGFNTYVMTEDSLTPEVAEWVDSVVSRFNAFSYNTGTLAYKKPLVLLRMKSGANKCAGITLKNALIGGETRDVVCPLFKNSDSNAMAERTLGSLKAIVGDQYHLGITSLLYDDSDYETNVLGLSADSIISVGEFDYHGNKPSDSIDVPANIELTLPEYHSRVYVAMNSEPAALNALSLYPSVNTQDILDDVVLKCTDGDFTFTLVEDTTWNIKQGSDVVGTCDAENANISIETESEDVVTAVEYNPA